VRSKNDENLSEDEKGLRAIPEREGEKPRVVHLDKPAAEKKYVVNLVKTFMGSDPNHTVGIIAAKKAQIKTYGEWLASEGIAYEQVDPRSTFSMAKPGVKVASAFGAKGLEFDRVIIPMFVEGNFPWGHEPKDEEAKVEFLVKMRNLVYVSMTRAKSSLIITYCGDKGSRFLGEMDPDLYERE
ncbi:MAG: hypothetical protein K6D90_05230, partial [Lachnospiraceae bacterium]|nr:hypothetical protein [Lachnospiraceae bacterium]